MSEFSEKAKTIATPRKLGKAERQAITDERDGSVAAYHTEHWDGHRDAEVLLKPVKAGPKEEPT